MKLAFTVCSNNFLAQAKTMISSLHAYNEDIQSFIFLSDKPLEGIDHKEFLPAQLKVIDEELVPGFNDLVARYSQFELNSILKPFLFDWLIARYPEERRIFYLDADLCFYDSLHEADKALEEYDIIITPHFLTPVPDDGLEPFENSALNFGTYNLGFLALNPQTKNTREFLKWWGDRTRKFGHYDTSNGYFVDQIWFNLVPVFFKKVLTFRHPGYNMAAWNLHERKIQRENSNGRVMLESGDPLVFYHFSSYDPAKPGLISWKYNRYNPGNSPGVSQICMNYSEKLKKNGFEKYSAIPCALPVRKARKPGAIRRYLSPGIQLLKKAWRKI